MAKLLKEQQAAMLKAGFFAKDTFKKKAELLLILKTGVAGLRYRVDRFSPEGKALLAKLTPGTELRLFRDPQNVHDQWAVAVYTTDDEMLGYLTRFKNESVARLLDYGKEIKAVVDEPPREPESYVEERRTRASTEDFNLPIAVYLVD